MTLMALFRSEIGVEEGGAGTMDSRETKGECRDDECFLVVGHLETHDEVDG